MLPVRRQRNLLGCDWRQRAKDAGGEVAWRIAHSDVVTEAALVGGRLVLTSFAGQLSALDPRTGRPTA